MKKSVVLKAAAIVASLGFLFSAQAKNHKTCSCASKEIDDAAYKLSEKAKDTGSKVKEATYTGKAKVKDVATTAKVKAKDVAITAKVKAALALREALKSTAIKVTTENQNVLLSGIVKTWEQKELAESVASSVDGVKTVENIIVVRSKN